ncbi:alkaline phosphatase [Vibrio sp. F74]|uniref:alkaline phosphatase n=1 Tax=Vibrio sp. F74 TaxID=700020 RepID=UPI0035F5577E
MKFDKTIMAITMSFTLVAPVCQAEVKNLILMIGDGMGPQQVGLLELYAREAPNSIYKDKSTAISKFAEEGLVGMSLVHPDDSIVVDSACSATQLAIGQFAPSEVIGLDAKGNPAETVLEKAKRLGKATGLVSDTRITHATPASFAAHQPHRSLENTIAAEMLESGVDVMLSGGIRHWLPKEVNDKGKVYNEFVEMTDGAVKIKSKRKDSKNLIIDAQEAGYQIAFTKDQLAATNSDSKLLGLFAYSGMYNGIRYTATKDDPKRTQPTLKEMTMKALDVLSQDEDGFFLMIEGGQIDWAGHNNDAGTMLHDLLKFDEAIEYVYEWVQKRTDTMVVITADHETGSFGFSYSAANLPKAKKLPGSGFADREYKPNFNFGDKSLLDRLYAQSMSFDDMTAEFYGLDKAMQTPEAFRDIMNNHTDFPITLEQAKAILTDVPNPYKTPGHSYLSADTLPAIRDFQSFYVYGDEIRWDLMGRALAEQQNIVWGTGTHTSTPVGVIAWGPMKDIKPFSQITHHSQVGQYMMDNIK